MEGPEEILSGKEGEQGAYGTSGECTPDCQGALAWRETCLLSLDLHPV